MAYKPQSLTHLELNLQRKAAGGIVLKRKRDGAQRNDSRFHDDNQDRDNNRQNIQEDLPLPSPISTENFYPDLRDLIKAHPKGSLSLHIQKWISVLSKLSTPIPIKLKEFRKQVSAFKAASKYPGLSVFAFEFDEARPGIRRFAVARLDEFWVKYNQMKLEERCFYEVIKQGAPVRLYFDIEYSIPLNPTTSGESCIQTLKTLIQTTLLSHYKVQITLSNILDLDSSTLTKFSRHLIVHMDDFAFQDNTHVGRFVEFLVSKMDEIVFSDAAVDESYRQKVRNLYVLNDAGHSRPFIDTAVYTKNRNFRIWKSCKIGKGIPLEISSSNLFPIPAKPTETSQYELFLDTLVTAPNHSSRILSFDAQTPPSNSTSASASFQPGKPKRAADDRISSPISQFPQIDTYVLSQIQATTNLPTPLRSVTYFPSTLTLIYTLSPANRYCHSIHRQHKSNGVFYAVELRSGVWWQGCFDVECRRLGKRLYWTLPLEYYPWVGLDGVFDEADNIDNHDDDESEGESENDSDEDSTENPDMKESTVKAPDPSSEDQESNHETSSQNTIDMNDDQLTKDDELLSLAIRTEPDQWY